MRLVLEAVRAEFLKLDRPVNEADFRWPGPAAELSHVPEKIEEPVIA